MSIHLLIVGSVLAAMGAAVVWFIVIESIRDRRKLHRAVSRSGARPDKLP